MDARFFVFWGRKRTRKILRYLEKGIRICYNASRQKVMSLAVWSTKTPEVASSGVFYSVLAGWLMP